jgi:hypothetical protein
LSVACDCQNAPNADEIAGYTGLHAATHRATHHDFANSG